VSLDTAWTDPIPDSQWAIYERVMDAATRQGIPFLLGGAFALAAYTGHGRNTKDLDLYILPEERARAIRLLTDLGLRDYHPQLPYQRHWIYRAVAEETILDLIWQMPNERAEVDESWFLHAARVELWHREVLILPPEELLWTKIYVLQRDRCDWPDILNLLHRVGARLDWERLLDRLEEDTPLLAGLLSVFAWLAPGRAQEFPYWIWKRLGLAPPPACPVPVEDPYRLRLLDSRDWFGPILPPGAPLEV
jgi:hypothetical protein